MRTVNERQLELRVKAELEKSKLRRPIEDLHHAGP